MKKLGRLLVVEDDPLYAAMLVEALEREGFSVSHADTVAEVLALSTREVFDVALLDVQLPDASGLDLLGPLGEQQPDCRIVVMTGHASVESAVKAMQQGATDYLAKPFPTEAVLLKVRHLLRVRGLEAELAALRDRGAVSGLEGHNRRFLNALRTTRTAATTEVSVLLLGEEGVGKEQFAELIHRESGRPGRLVKVNCGAVPAHLMDAELFGHEPGAFADAHLPRTGALEQADQGTLFLDEVGTVPLAVQAKLARALRDRTYRRLGGKRDLTVGFRMVAATPRDLEELLRQGCLREDFHQQLGVVVVEVPPLRSRTEDIPLLVERFVRGLSETHQVEPIQLEPEAVERLLAHAWPGNVGELRLLVERLQVLHPGATITPRHLPAAVGGDPAKGGVLIEAIPTSLDLRQAVDQFERNFIERVIAEEGGNKAAAARRLGVARETLWKKTRG